MSKPAQASDPPPHGLTAVPVVIEYRSSSSCPGFEAFAAQIQARTNRARAPVGEEPRWSFLVTLDSAQQPVVGAYAATDPGGIKSSGEVAGTTCDSVVQAIALIVALAIDPQAEKGPVASRPIGPMCPKKPATRPTAPVCPKEPAPKPPLVHHTDSWRLAPGLEASIVGNVMPDVLLAPGAFLHLTGPSEHGLDSGRYRVTLLFTVPQQFETDTGTADFRFTDVRALVCPFAMLRKEGAGVWPCATLDLGLVQARGEEISSTEDHDRLWVAPGLGVNIGWTIWSTLEVEGSGGVNVPTTRDSYFFRPSEQVHETEWAGGWASLGIGWIL